MTTFFKAVRPDGTSFHDHTFRWLPEDGQVPDGGWLVKHPDPAPRIGKDTDADASGYLSVSVEAADCTGFKWPCRLLLIEPVGRAMLDDTYPNKRRVRSARVVAEVEPWRVFGPNGAQVVAFLDLLRSLPDAAWDAAWDTSWAAARDAAWDAAWDAARAAAWAAAWDAARAAAWAAARAAAWDAALALVVRDLISPEQFATLTAPMRAAGINFDRLGGVS